jgi:uncharacterized protein (TIGR03437 family)
MRVTTRLFPLTLLLCWLSVAAPVDRIRTIDNRQTSILRNHTHPAAVAANDRGVVDPAMVMDHMLLMVKPSAAQQLDLDRLLVEQQNPSSPNYHKWLTPEEFGGRFGLSAGDKSKVVAWLKGEGFTINEVARGSNWVTFTGNAGQVSRTFRTSIHQFEVKGKKRFANISDPEIPAALAEVVGGIDGFNDLEALNDARVVDPAYTNSNGSHILTPEDYATIYNINPLYKTGFDGTGLSIGIVGVNGLNLNDVRQFRNTFGLPANDPIVVPYSSASLVTDLETALDVERSGAVAPRAQVYYYYGPSPFGALTYAVNLNNVQIISSSWGTSEANASPLFYRSALQQANSQGITVLAASFDGGAGGAADQFAYFATHGPTLVFPASLPEVTGVGGTMFVEGTGTYWSTTNTDNLGSALSYIPEAAWNESRAGVQVAGSTGGPSVVYAKPVWQNGPGVPDDNARDVPDIALTSAGHDPYFVVLNGSSVNVEGTSAASPSMAGIVALLEHYLVSKGVQKKGTGLGNINPQLYRLAQAAPTSFHDIVSGDNKVPCVQGAPGCLNGSYGYSTGPGYDMVTGLGSVDAYNFVTQFNSAANAVTVTVTSNPTRATFSDTIQLTATVVAATKGAGTPTGSVDFSTSATVPLGTGILGSDGTATVSVPGYLLGSAGTGTYAVYAQYSGDVGFSGGGGRVLVTIANPPAGVSGIIPSVSNSLVWPVMDNQGWVWQETVRIREAAGVPSILIGFTIDGVDQPLATYFPSGEIPASTTVSSTQINFRLTSYPVTKTFGFTGVDASGNPWSVQTTALFQVPPQISAGFAPTLVPLTMTQNTSADPSCQWSQQLFLDETQGYSTTVSSLTQGSSPYNTGGLSIASQVPVIFGTTRLFSWGSVSGTICWSGVTPGTTSELYVSTGLGYNQTLQVSFAGPPASPVQMAATPSTITMTAADSNTTATGTFAVSISDKSQAWTASVFPANRTTSWLNVSQLSGTGNATIKLQANGTGFEPGVYRATIVFQSPSAVPSTVNVPLMFVLGSGTITGDTVISGVVNAASLKANVSPGMIALINGSNLANSMTNAPVAPPYPFSLSTGGVSVQVNGIPAPILAISPAQLMVMIPYEAGAGPAVLGVNNNGQIAGYQLQIAPAAPGIFTDASGFVTGQANAVLGGKLAFTLTGDGDVNSTIPDGFTPTGTATLPSTIRARLPFTVTVGGLGVFVTAYGLQPTAFGTTLVNIVLPGWVPTGVQPVVVTVNGVDSPPAMLNVSAQ